MLSHLAPINQPAKAEQNKKAEIQMLARSTQSPKHDAKSSAHPIIIQEF
jgi:hypothetical protein